jgi:signal transduction histidine kinase
MSQQTETSGAGGLLRGFRAEWREIGGLGRVAVIGLGVAAILTVAMGFSITGSARANLLNARADLIANEVRTLPDLGLANVPGEQAFEVFDAAAHHGLMGSETERVKVWAPDGRIVYSDATELIGGQFGLSSLAVAAFGGEVTTHISDLDDPAHAGERAHGQLIEVYVPVVGPDGSVMMVVEVEQRLDSLNEAMGSITRNVWLSIGAGVGVLAIFLVALATAVARGINRRRRQAESLLGALFQAQEEERRHIVGSLHDDVGQPLYRLLYGLEGSRAKLDDEDPVAAELENLEDIVRQVDVTLRGELDYLYQGLAADAGLATAIRDLAATTESESGLDVHTDLAAEPGALTAVGRTALFRAAQEGVVNVRKHADADSVWVDLRVDDNRVTVEVADDGVGFGGESHLGLTTTRERLEALGGGMAVRRRRGGGSVFTAWLPAERTGS